MLKDLLPYAQRATGAYTQQVGQLVGRFQAITHRELRSGAGGQRPALDKDQVRYVFCKRAYQPVAAMMFEKTCRRRMEKHDVVGLATPHRPDLFGCLIVLPNQG